MNDFSGFFSFSERPIYLIVIIYAQELSYLGAVLARKKEKRFEEVIVLLNESTDSHFKELQVWLD